MRQKPEARGESAEKTVRDIRRATRRRYSAEDKIRIRLSEELDNLDPERLTESVKHADGGIFPAALQAAYVSAVNLRIDGTLQMRLDDLHTMVGEMHDARGA